MRKTCLAVAAAIGILSAVATQAQTAPAPTPDAAARFGALEAVSNISLSPDGTHIAYITPSVGSGNDLYVVGTGDEAIPQMILRAGGNPEQLSWCGWESSVRLVCAFGGERGIGSGVYGFSRLISLNATGGAVVRLGSRRRDQMSRPQIIDWLPEVEGHILAIMPDGAVSDIDVSDSAMRIVQNPRNNGVGYLTDGHGNIRIMISNAESNNGMNNEVDRFYYRPAIGGPWQPLSTRNLLSGEGFQPLAIDQESNRAIGFAKIGGRQTVRAISLEGTLTEETLFAHSEVDVDSIVRIGSSGRVNGISFSIDRRQVVYFDHHVAALSQSLSRALGGRIVYLIDASSDESRYLIWAGSDTDAGEYFLYTSATRQLRPLLAERPQLEGLTLSSVQSITYPAADGTMIPGYLTLPPGRSDARGLPAIVMPHGGPSARDEWGFDWMAQYFANQGYAVLQPNFRGSSGYGDAWYQNNGFQSWRTAIGDVTDAGRWLVSAQGVDANKLSIVGWSYGGYAALQSGVLAPDLFRSIVAIAPVTDLAQLKREESGYVTGRINRDFIGSGPHIEQGSPARNAATIAVPVLMFHGLLDTNVDIEQSRTMRRELQRAGRTVELVEYPDLAHNLGTSEARTDMLRRITAFLPH
ncbi:MAG: S9 family peptidase [Pseudomonadota bacterium]